MDYSFQYHYGLSRPWKIYRVTTVTAYALAKTRKHNAVGVPFVSNTSFNTTKLLLGYFLFTPTIIEPI